MDFFASFWQHLVVLSDHSWKGSGDRPFGIWWIEFGLVLCNASALPAVLCPLPNSSGLATPFVKPLTVCGPHLE